MAGIRMTAVEQLAVGGGPERSGGAAPTACPPAAARVAGRLDAITASGMGAAPDPEVPEKAVRRRFSAAYKRRIVEEADGCTEPGQIGSLLRREGLYSSHLSTWRDQRDQGTIAGFQPKQRGPKSKRGDPLVGENERLRRENQRLRKRLRQAEVIIDIQKKASEILGISLESSESDEDA